MFVLLWFFVVAADSGDSRFRYLGGSLYLDVTAQEIDTAFENCTRTYQDYIGRLYGGLSEVIEHLLAVIYSGDKWQEFVDNLPPSVLIVNQGHPPSPSAQVHVSPAIKLLFNEIIACTEDTYRAYRRLQLEQAGIRQIRNLVHPLGFVEVFYLTATKDGEFLDQQELVKKWANPGPEALCQELYERGNALVASGWKALQSLNGSVAADEVILNAGTRDGETVRRRRYGRRG